MFKKLTLTLAAAALAAPAYADISSGNEDLYQWVVEDYQLRSKASPRGGANQGVEHGISGGNSDLYGWAVEDPNLRNVQRKDYEFGPAQLGIGDSYGSVLYDIGLRW